MKKEIEEKALNAFADLMIKKIGEVSTNWKKPWFSDISLKNPVNFNFMGYYSVNALMLSLEAGEKGYQYPWWTTFNRIASLNKAKNGQQATDAFGKPLPHVGVNRGEKGFPIYKFYSLYFNKENKSEKPLYYSQYMNLSPSEKDNYQERRTTGIDYVFNVEQTNIKDVRPELYEKIVNHFTQKEVVTNGFSFEPVDTMISDNRWVCPIKPTNGDRAFYSISKDEIVVPEKSQFENGQEFYSNLFHEMAHSTGSKERLNRFDGTNGVFGSPEYAKEELVAELTAALTAKVYGIVKYCDAQSAQYLKCWLEKLDNNTDFIKSALKDVGRAHNMLVSYIEGCMDVKQKNVA